MNENGLFEMAFPFKSIRYEDGVTEWGINFSRLDAKIRAKIEAGPPFLDNFQTRLHLPI